MIFSLLPLLQYELCITPSKGTGRTGAIMRSSAGLDCPSERSERLERLVMPVLCVLLHFANVPDVSWRFLKIINSQEKLVL